MKRRLACLIAAFLIAVGSADVYANVSSAAVLFLRIAAGARAAGMGEAFVAVADDATTTHWNPAGLGTYPLAGKWFEIKIPGESLPFRKVELFKNEGSAIDYKKFDIWALTESGLVKYNEGKWTMGETIEPSSEATAESILRQYAGLSGDAAERKIPGLIEKLARANNAGAREEIDSLREQTLRRLPAEYSGKEELENAFNILAEAYNGCLIDWPMFNQAGAIFADGMKDSILQSSEADKMLVTLEKSKRRFLPAELTMPFELGFEGRLNDIAADNDFLWVVSDSGLYRYNGRNWQRLVFADDSLYRNYQIVRVKDQRVYVGTDAGLIVYDAGAFTFFGDNDSGLPAKRVQGVAAKEKNDLWAIVDGDLYHFDGVMWKNYYEYKDVLAQTDSAIYENMKIYDTQAEREKYLAKYKALNPTADNYIRKTMQLYKMVDELGVIGAILEAKFGSLNDDDSTQTSEIGRIIKIPYLAGLDFEPTDIEVDERGAVWIGTEYGIIKYDGHKWSRFGYKFMTPDTDITAFDFALDRVKGDSARAERLAENIKAVNQLDGDTLRAGRPIAALSNPAGARINEIESVGDKIYFSTEAGIIYYGDTWARVNENELGRKNGIAVRSRDNNLWFAADDRIYVYAGAGSQISMMHVNWLPTFANDMYYDFFSYVRPVEGWGTVGGNITFLSYGNITRTDEAARVLGEFLPFDIALSLSYGTPLSQSLSGGLSAKIIYSHLSSIGAGQEKGSGTSTGLALDAGILYRLHRRINLGVAVTNLGPDISYIDVSQADPLPRNLAVGLAWKMIESAYNKALITVEANKSLVAMGDGFSEELKEVILNGGAEYWYGSFIAFRGGYIYDQEGDVRTPTLGFGLAYRLFQFDFAYIPSSDEVPLANTMRFSLSINM
jgi:hypothetical protein